MYDRTKKGRPKGPPREKVLTSAMVSACRRPSRRCLTSRRCHLSRCHLSRRIRRIRRTCLHESRPSRRCHRNRCCHPYHRCHRCCRPFHHRSIRRCRPCHRCRNCPSHPCRRCRTTHRYSGRQTASQCSCPTCCYRCLTSQSAMSRMSRRSAHPGPRHPSGQSASCLHRRRPACSRLRVTIPLTSFPTSHPTTHRIPTSPACRSCRDPCRRR